MTRVMTWIDSTGTRTPFDGSQGILLMNAPVGVEAPNPANVVDAAIFDGGVLVSRRKPARDLALGLFVEHPTRAMTPLGYLARILQGPGQLEWADEVNIRTLKNVIYEAGIDGSGEVQNVEARSVVASLIALDPYWYGAQTSVPMTISGTTPFDAALAFDSITAFDGGGTATIAIAGDVDAWPVFTIRGPATQVVMTSGAQTWATALPIGGADTLVVDHRPESRGPSLNGNPINWALLTEASRLFPLQVGTVSVLLSVTGASGATSITVAWSPRYLTA